MKRWIVLAIFLIAASAWAGPPKINGTTVSKINGLAAAKCNGLAGASVGGCGTCTESNDSQFTASAVTMTSTDSPGSYIQWAWEFSIASTKCITGVTWVVYDSSDTGRGATCGIYSNSSNAPGTIIESASISELGYHSNTPTLHEFIFSSSIELTSGTYWAVCEPNDNYNLSVGLADSHTGTMKYSSDGTTWNDTAWNVMLGVLGCE